MASLYGTIDLLLRRLDAETAHRFAIRALASGLVGGTGPSTDPRLRSTVFGLSFASPIGMAAGFDKNAEVPDALMRVGFGFVETGTVTPLPQPGNPRPRLFRLAADAAVINRMGFPGEGLEAVRARLSRRPRHGILGINVGANKDSADRADDYARCAAALAPLADYLVCNVSSPNTPGLRDLQGRDALIRLLTGVRLALGEARVPVLVKIAPDVTAIDIEDIVSAVLEARIDGIIIGNTTVSRPATLQSPAKTETGGLSGRPLFALSTRVLRDTARLVNGRVPLIGCGGIASAADAYAKIRAGASLVQLYTALVYEGPALVRRLERELAELLAGDGFARVADAVGADVR